MKTYLSIILFSLFLVGLNSCSKEECTYTDATIVYGGDPAGDGTGWMIYIDSTNNGPHGYFVPDNLSPAYHINGKKVKIKYSLSQKQVFLGWSYYYKIHIFHISNN